MQQPNEFLALLEAERNDLSYRYASPRHVPTKVVTVFSNAPEKVVNIVRADKERERKMFNAGRYAAGARDKVAMAANKWLQREMNRK